MCIQQMTPVQSNNNDQRICSSQSLFSNLQINPKKLIHQGKREGTSQNGKLNKCASKNKASAKDALPCIKLPTSKESGLTLFKLDL